MSDMDSSFSALQYLGRDLKKSLDASSSTEIDRELKDVASSIDNIRDSLDRAKRTQEVKLIFLHFNDSLISFFYIRKMNQFVIELNVH